MKQKLLYIYLIIICACAWSGQAWGQTYNYLDVQIEPVEWLSPNSTDGFELPEPHGTILFFQAKRTPASIFKVCNTYPVWARSSTNNKNWRDEFSISMDNLSQWYSGHQSIQSDSKYVCFQSKTNATGYRQIQNVKISRATTLSASNQSFDNVTLNVTSNITFDVTFSNEYNPQTFSAKTTDDTSSAFSVNSVEVGNTSYSSCSAPINTATGTVKVNVSFTPTEEKDYSGTVVLQLGSTTLNITLTGTGTKEKGTPSFTWNVTNAYKNHSYTDFFTTTNADCPYRISSDNSSLGDYKDGKLVFKNKEGTVHFTVIQDGNDDWNAKEETYTVVVTEAQNHLPLPITDSNYSTLVRKISGDLDWSNDGLHVSNNGYNDKTIEICFEGIPDQISFDYKKENWAATGISWNMKVSPDGYGWTTVWNSSDNSGTEEFSFVGSNYDYSNCRYVRLTYSGNFDATFKNVNITELKYLTIDKESLSFGTNTKGNTVTPQTFTVSHCNAGYGVTIVSNDANFTVSPSSLETTGGDLMGTETITVSYLNNSVGSHSGTITISDPSGTNPSKTLTVTGTTQTTYYTRAEATHNTGGNAYASFTSYDAAVSATETKNSGLTTNANATATAYYKAVANSGYVFAGWTWPNDDYTDGYVSENATDKYENYTYNSESSGSPTIAAFKAWFAPVFNFDATYSKNRDGGTVTATVAETTVTGAPDATSASTTATFTATATSGSYVFKEWRTSVDAATYESRANPYRPTVTNSGEPGSKETKSLVAIFAPIYKFSATASVGSVDGGTAYVSDYSSQVEGAPDATQASTTAIFTAIASDDYEFQGWSETMDGAIVSSANPYTPTITNDGAPGSTKNFTLYAIFKLVHLRLDPSEPDYTADCYKQITLQRTLKAGYSTIALPFNTSVEEIVGTGYDQDLDWVAQLKTVTYSQLDGYTLYFDIVDDGVITANQPYVMHLQTAIPNPTWTNVDVVAAEAASPIHPQTGYSGYAGWSMVSNYTVNFPMDGKYGIVNSQDGLMLGSGENARLNAFSAYITAPSGSNNAPRLRVAYVAPDGTATVVEGLSPDVHDSQGEPVAIYGPDGKCRSRLQRGVNIVRYSDGSVRKVQY